MSCYPRLIPMQIFWHGFSCVRIEGTHGNKETTLVTDPFESELGLRFPRTLSPDIVVLSHQERKKFPLDAFENKPFVIDNPGEYEVDGMFVFANPLKGEGSEYPYPMMHRFEIEGISVGYLGGIHRALEESEIAKLDNIDVLLLPVGGGPFMNAKQAIETINLVEPRIVVPLYHHVEGVKLDLGTADAFCKELGVCKRQDANKLKLSRKDLPADELIVTVLQRA